MSSFYNLTGFLKECPPPAHCPTPPLILPVSPLHRHFYMVVTVSGPAFVEPSRGPPGAGGGGGMGGGVLHTNLSPHLRLRRRSRSANQTKARWLLHCQCLGLFPPAEENMIATALKNIWSFAPHRCATSQMWRPDRSPPEGPSFLFQSRCFELSSAASPI